MSESATVHATLAFERMKSTIQLISFVGQDMVKGHENGTNASLDNLVNFFSNQKGR